MKKTILLTVCIIIAVCSAQAQTETETETEKTKNKKVKFGFRTGYELQVNDSNLDSKLNLPYFGVLTDITISEKWSLQIELNLRSANREELFLNGFKQSYNEVYLTVPALLKYHINDNFKIYTGTQVLSASLVNDIYGLKKWNGILGVEYNLSEKFFIEARFRHGFEERRFKNNFRNNTIGIGIGYKF
jgi:opacity protein-like surface antigen